MRFWDAPCAKKPSDSGGWMGRWAAPLLIDPFGSAIQAAGSRAIPAIVRSANVHLAALTASLARFRLLHDFKLDLLDFRQPLPLARQDVIHLFVQMTDFELRLQVHAIIILGPQTVLRLLPLLAHHDDRSLDGRQA